MKLLKKSYLFFGSIILVLFIGLFFLSLITKNYITNNSKELIGRKIEIGNLNFNYIKLSIRATDVVVYEVDDKRLFAGFKELYVNYTLWKLIRNEHSFSEIKLDSLYVNIEMDGDKFNFDDLIPEDDSTKVEKNDSIENNLRFSIHNIDFSRGKISFFDKQMNNRLLFEDLNLNLPLIAWDNNKSEVGVKFEFGKNGVVVIDADYDIATSKYDLFIDLKNLDLSHFSNYVKPYLAINSMNGYLTSTLNISGNSVNVQDVLISGSSFIKAFELYDESNLPLVKIDSINAVYDSLKVGDFDFHLKSIKTYKPTIYLSINKDMSNWDKAMKSYFLTDSLNTIAISEGKIPFDSTVIKYGIDTLLVADGLISIVDNTLNRPFSYDCKELNFNLFQLKNDGDAIPLNFKVNMNNYGMLSGDGIFSMLDFYKVNLNVKVDKVGMMSFSPYSEYFVGRPITKGNFNYNLNLDMNSQAMNSQNVFKVSMLEFGEKTGDTTAMGGPIRLALYILKDKDDNIIIDLPVTGHPTDPEFTVGKIIWKTLKNFLLKTAISPFNALGNLVGTTPSELETMPFEYGQGYLSTHQKELLTKVAELITKKPELQFSFHQMTNPENEKIAIAINLSKESYIKSLNIPELLIDTIAYNAKLETLDLNDTGFLQYLYNATSLPQPSDLNTLATHFISKEKQSITFENLLPHRNNLLSSYLIDSLKVNPTNIKVETSDLRNIPAELKSPNFKIGVTIK